MPHDPTTVHQTKGYIIERCKLCGIRKRWNKGFKGRVDNIEYARFHVRSLAQKNGSTRRVHAKIYDKDKLVIKV